MAVAADEARGGAGGGAGLAALTDRGFQPAPDETVCLVICSANLDQRSTGASVNAGLPSQLTIQPTPNLSTSMPKCAPQKVSANGMVTNTAGGQSLEHRFAADRVLGRLTDMEKPAWPPNGWPGMRSLAMKRWPPASSVACMTLCFHSGAAARHG